MAFFSVHLDGCEAALYVEELVLGALVLLVPARPVDIPIPDAVAAFGEAPKIVWCTGPSKTADVEGILIEGVHGPGEQIALLV